MKDLLFVSNGHGEDDIACKIIDALKTLAPHLTIDVWPMVGEGAAYRQRHLTIVAPGSRLPSEGFATLSWSMMRRDLRAGWIGVHLRQIWAALRMKKRYRMAVAVGDIVPIVASVLARLPFVFVGCAKSSYYAEVPFHGYLPIEKYLLRVHCRLTFPRDVATIAELQHAGVSNRYVGNPMMDGLEGSGDVSAIAGGRTVVAMLAGTRADAEDNLIALLAAAARVGGHVPHPGALRFVFAARAGLDPNLVRDRIARESPAWTLQDSVSGDLDQGIVVRASHAGGMDVLVAKGRFADVLHAGTIAVGMAGTANEQAVGLGLPVIAVPSAGPQNESYVAMKQYLFGTSAIAVGKDPEQIATEIAGLLTDPARRAAMARVGHERMGDPGASMAIAREILAALGALA